MLQYWIWLTKSNSISSRSILRLLQSFGTPEAIYGAAAGELARVEGVTKQELTELTRHDVEGAERILNECYEKDIRIITYQDSGYPAALRMIPDPPMVLYCKGRLPNFETRPTIAVVGARKASAYGMTTAKRLGYQLGRCGAILASGMAQGVDAMAMEGALTAGGPVVGVLGCGVDVIYPPQNAALYRDTMRGGCLLSEYIPGTRPLSWHFPVRNRIISGLSNGVLVVEASANSGSLITAQYALEQGRDVFAVPGNIDNAACQGSNGLLRQGAILTQTGWDVVQEYESIYPDTISVFSGGTTLSCEPLKVASPVQTPVSTAEKEVDKRQTINYIDLKELKQSLCGDESAVVEALERKQCQVDELIDVCRLPTSRVLAALTMLEVKGIISRLPGKRFCLKKSE